MRVQVKHELTDAPHSRVADRNTITASAPFSAPTATIHSANALPAPRTQITLRRQLHGCRTLMATMHQRQQYSAACHRPGGADRGT